MFFVIKFCTRLVTKITANASDETKLKEANDYSIFATSRIFEHVARTKGYSTYKPLVRIPDDEKQFLLDCVVDEWTSAGESFKVLDEWHPGVRDAGVQPFVTESSSPNVFSPFHLIAQSHLQEFVSSPSSVLIV